MIHGHERFKKDIIARIDHIGHLRTYHAAFYPLKHYYQSKSSNSLNNDSIIDFIESILLLVRNKAIKLYEMVKCLEEEENKVFN